MIWLLCVSFKLNMKQEIRVSATSYSHINSETNFVYLIEAKPVTSMWYIELTRSITGLK